MKRRNFLKALPAAALTLAGCGQHKTAPANTASLVFDHSYPLDYAAQFSADCYEGGYVMIDIPDAGRFLVVPEGAAEVDDLPEDVVVLRQPLDHIYLVSTSVMDLFVHLDALDSIALSGTKAEGWYVEEAKQAMQEGRIAYAGKYSAPDYERILAAGCTLAIENTMVLHDPEVKEQLEKFGVPVLVERSSYESGPLARMEWLKLYGILLNKTEMAEEVFRQKVEQVAPILEQENTGKTAAFFSITTNNLITVRRTSDYVAQMVGMAGGVYIFDDLEGETSAQSTIKLPLETFYARARDADVLIYNSTIEGVMETRDQLIEKCPMLADFKAVQSGDCWCTAQSLFQQSMELADLISDMNLVFTEARPTRCPSVSYSASYKRSFVMTTTRRLSLAYLALTAGVAVLFALNLFWGSVSLTPGAVAAALLGRGEDALAMGIVLQLRLPRAVMVVLLGAALSAAGYLLQTFFANPIAGPFVMGVSSGAKLAVALTMVVFYSRGCSPARPPSSSPPL